MNILHRICVGTAVVLLPLFAAAQAYPSKPIRVIVAVPAGGTPDVVMRMVAPGLSNSLGQQLIVDNRGGAGGLIGAEFAAKAPADGYTLFWSAPGPLTIQPLLHRQAPYDPLKDFAPVSLVSIGPYLLLTHPSVPVKTVKELLALAKAQPGKLNYSSAGNGSTNHLATELFKNMAGVPGYEWLTWFGLLVPAQTPKAIIARLNAALVEVVRAPEMKSQFEVVGYTTVGSSAEEFAAFMRTEARTHAKAAKLSDVKVD